VARAEAVINRAPFVAVILALADVSAVRAEAHVRFLKWALGKATQAPLLPRWCSLASMTWGDKARTSACARRILVSRPWGSFTTGRHEGIEPKEGDEEDTSGEKPG